VKQVLERGFTVVDVSARIGVPKHTLYGWVQAAKKTARSTEPSAGDRSESAEIRRLKAELRRVTEERDILKKAAVSSTRRRNDSVEDIGWRSKSQGFPRPFVETPSNPV
jgi:transposase